MDIKLQKNIGHTVSTLKPGLIPLERNAGIIFKERFYKTGRQYKK